MGISKQMQMEEMHRVSVLEYDEDDMAKSDDAAWCAKNDYRSSNKKECRVKHRCT
jgi:hypothetical protein